MLPHEKEMVKRLADKSFALIGINSDGDRSVVNEILKRENITWRQAIEGSTRGPLATSWNVKGWPTIYILDAKGVIRFKNLRNEKMEDAVNQLLKEAEAETQK
ncbi:TlpA family protein disulfide reductase [Armatimonas sp.]|uniref:TlpA family protein disulfide reductase n=1 Tax=Armatimonas sp. TaxID=1872638 RepID=UPI00374D304A